MSLGACWLGGNLLSCYSGVINFYIPLSNDLFSFLGTKYMYGSMEICKRDDSDNCDGRSNPTGDEIESMNIAL